ncbi:MAG TPA: heme-binding domain-containing protein [Thermomicrobiales bacterium]|nr:heme-binding domain-containing protein [Thermomicrobiales bacterium]
MLYLIGGGLIAFALLIQLVPYGRDHANPPVTQAVQWNSPRTEALARVACFDCHSNETEWPLYSNVAPMSWLTQRDVDGGRAELNFSEWDREQEVRDVVETVQDGEMPPFGYTLAHPDARLSEQEKQELIDGFIATFGDAVRNDDDD